MSNYSLLDLYPHNINSYEKIKEQFLIDDVAAMVHATGTGKSFNALQLALDNKDKKILYVTPYNPIIEHEKEIIEKNKYLSLEKDFYNLKFRTYRSFINMSEEELAELDFDILVLDEFHHMGAPVWGARINTLIRTHENIKILGMTAYTVRDRGTIYERDMTNSETDELFSNKVVSTYDLCDAMIDGILPKPNYKSGYVYLENTYEYLENKISKLSPNSKDYKELYPLIKDIKRRLHEALSVSDIFKTNIKTNGKYIYFCPVISEEGKNDISTIMEEVKLWLNEMGLTKDDYELYMTTSDMGIKGKENRDTFYNDEDLNHNKVSNKLRIMFAINQYNEGVHVPGLDGVIMGRATSSDIVYFEQLGRALSVGNNNKKEYEILITKSKEELIELCSNRNLVYNENDSKEVLIDILLAPTIIDLANNISFIKKLENNLKDRVKEIIINKKYNKREIHIGSTKFDIDMINEDLFEILKYVRDRLTLTWEDNYELAKIYYEYHGNSEISKKFKTINGYEYDENGITLGEWITTQRRAYKNNKLTQERKELLEKIEIRLETNLFELEWYKKYELAKIYYEHYGNLEVPLKFKTINGYENDENGVSLGRWISTQKQKYQQNKLTQEQRELLKQIVMRFEVKKKISWKEVYELAKVYYEYYGNLKVLQNFKTMNGIEESNDKNAIALGSWLNTQRQACKNNKLTQEKIILLKQIGMRFEIKKKISWEENYELAKAYYEYYGNLEINGNFKTNDGINESNDKNAVSLGSWISTQRIDYSKNKLTQEQIKLLEQIGMRFENINDLIWQQKYELAKIYYEYYGNLEIPGKFKTINGYEYDEKGVSLGQWISKQRRYARKNKLTKEQIKLLEQIGMRFEIKDKELEWQQKYRLAKIYYEHYGNLEIPSKFKTLNGFDESNDKNAVSLGSWISTQRTDYSKNKLTQEQIKLLEQIGIRFETRDNDLEWQKKYQLAKVYYEHYGNLEVSQTFKTINGIDESDDKNAVALGTWIRTQRDDYSKNKISKERYDELKQIGMRFETINEFIWQQKYELAKIYYEHYGNLEVIEIFKTLNGYEESNDKDAVALGAWISKQRINYASKMLSQEQISKLKQIGMRFEANLNDQLWQKKYALAKIYYEYHGNLEVSKRFKTINGFEKSNDEKAVALGEWISNQRQEYKKNKLNQEQIKLLEEIGMRFETNLNEQLWQEKYELAKIYYEHHGNLEISINFKTLNGYEKSDAKDAETLGNWVNYQKQAYKGKSKVKLTPERIKLLEQIGIEWFTSEEDQNFKNEKITEENISRKKIELMNRFYSLLNNYPEGYMPSKEEINRDFTNQLNSGKRK